MTKKLAPLKPETKKLLAQCSSATLTTQLFKRGFRNVFLVGLSLVLIVKDTSQLAAVQQLLGR